MLNKILSYSLKITYFTFHRKHKGWQTQFHFCCTSTWKGPPKTVGFILFIYLLFYIAFNSQGHSATGSLQVEETSTYCTVNHRASASNYQLSNMKRPARDSNRRPQRLEARTLTAIPLSPLQDCWRQTD